MLSAVRQAVADGMPTIAECGGFLYLHETLSDDAGRPWPMAGVFPAGAENTGKLRRFGYVTLAAKGDGLLGPAGTEIPAHEFHYWESTAPGEAFHAQKPQSQRAWDCAYHTETMYAGFPHFHLCAAPEAAARFVEKCAEYQRKRETL